MGRSKSATPPPPSTELREALFREVKAEMWRRGELRWKLHADQLAIYLLIAASVASRFVLEIARRWGKTHLLAVIAIETCLRNPRGRVVYGAPTLKHLQEFILPAFEKLIEDAPPDCCPVWVASSGHWEFPNGAHIHLFGADDKRKANRGRGPAALLCIFDECGFTPILKYVLTSIFRPQLLTTGGKTLLGSTPAEEPEHDFTEIAARAEANGNYARRTIYDNPRLTPERIKEFIEEDAKEEGLSAEAYKETDTFRREYMAERVIDKLLVVVPEWAEKRAKLFIAIERPEFFNGMTILDFGGADPHAAHFGYWHPKVAKWVIEDEVLLRQGQNTAELAEHVKAKERELWGVKAWEGTLRGVTEKPTDELLACLPDWMANALDAASPTQPFTRWADNDLQLVRDLYELHGLLFIPTAKDDKQLQVNNLRVMFREEAILINPRCINTDRHLASTVWKDHKRKDYRRRGGEHGDLVDTLTYGARNLDRRDPEPADWHQAERLSPRKAREAEESRQALARAFLGRGPVAAKLMGRR